MRATSYLLGLLLVVTGCALDRHDDEGFGGDASARTPEPPVGAVARYRADHCRSELGGAVRCDDLSTGGHVASGLSAAAPRIEPGMFAGQPALVYKDGQVLQFGDANQSLGSKFTLAVVARHYGRSVAPLSLGGAAGVSATLSASASDGAINFSSAGSASVQWDLSGYVCAGQGERALGEGESYIAIGIGSSAELSLLVNGEKASTQVIGSFEVYLNGKLGGGAVGVNGDALAVAEAIIYDRSLTLGEVEQLYAYVALRYGITIRQCPDGAPRCGDGVVAPGEQCEQNVSPACSADCGSYSGELECSDQLDNDGDGARDCADADCNASATCRTPKGSSCTTDRECARDSLCTAYVCADPACSDGYRDGAELARDCGGSCAACDGTQCEAACRTGEPTEPGPEPNGLLPFERGVFTRATPATYFDASGRLVTARAHELRWLDLGGARMALFEGASTNLLRASEKLDDKQSWVPADELPMTVTADALVAPDGVRSAELLTSPVGPARSPAQSSRVEAGSLQLSVFMRAPDQADDDRSGPLARGYVRSEQGAVLGRREWMLKQGWDRYVTPVSATARESVHVGLAQDDGYPGDDDLATTPASYGVWGLQLEPQPFATSYIPSTGESATRAADSLVFSELPLWLSTGVWQFDVSPGFAPDQMRADVRYTLLSFNASQAFSLVRAGERAAVLEVRLMGGNVSSAPLTWEADSILTITVDAPRKQVTVRGSDQGEVSFALSGAPLNALKLRVGGALGGRSEAFAAISELRRVSAATVTCELDAACTCGNGVVDPGEECDSALSAGCSDLCARSPRVTRCGGDEDCASGQLCGQDVGEHFGLETSADVCWPASCASAAATQCGQAQSACGTRCVCLPSCAGKTCGGDLSDGCGGVCEAVCEPKVPGCVSDGDCTAGHVCGRGAGARFGLGDVNVCWPAQCADYDRSRVACGDGASTCGTCAPATNHCGARVCGTDDQGQPCGTCADGDFCSEDGTCAPVPAAFEIQHPTFAAVLPSANVDPVGTLPGQADVSDLGAASYSIPIEVPPGRAGMTPDLALVYNSNAGDSYLGAGWSMRGLSQISHCNQTFAQNELQRGVALDGNDPFCLDGEQLVRIPNDDVSGQLAEFRTEFDSFRKVIALGSWFDSAGFYQGPLSWAVYGKNGLVYVYGASANARSWARREAEGRTGTTNLAWYLQAVQDQFGNQYFIEYENYARTPLEVERSLVKEYSGEVRPKAVVYGAQGSHRIDFNYRRGGMQPHTYPRSFSAGVASHMSMPLETINTSVFGAPVRRYTLSITDDAGLYRLDGVTLAGANPDGTFTSLPPTVFEYEARQTTWSRVGTTSNKTGELQLQPRFREYPLRRRVGYSLPSVLSIFPRTVFDADGDGRQDLLHAGPVSVSDYVSIVRLRDIFPSFYFQLDRSLGTIESGKGFKVVAGGIEEVCSDVQIVDIDRGRVDDRLYGPCANQSFELQAFGNKRIKLGQADQMWAVDRNGDAQTDVVACEDGAWFYFDHASLSCAEKTCRPAPTPLPQVTLPCKAALLDADRDGHRSLMLFTAERREQAFVLVGETARYWGSVPFGWDTQLQRLIDANGDGLEDVVVANKQRKSLQLYLNTANGFSLATELPGIPERFEQSFVVDQDGDGRSDLMIPDQASMRWQRHEPLRAGAEGVASWSVSDSGISYRWVYKKTQWRRHKHKEWTAWDWQMPTAMDWDGDGTQEIVMRAGKDTDPVFEIWKGGSRKAGLLKNVQDGLGKLDSFTYIDRAGEFGYTPRPEGSACPERQHCPVRPPRPLVVSHSVRGSAGPYRDPGAPAPSQVDRRFSYQYQEAREHVEGRGWLGFVGRTVIESAPLGLELGRTETRWDLDTWSDSLRAFWGSGHPTVVTMTVQTDRSLTQEGGTEHRTRVSNEWTANLSFNQRPFIALDKQSTEWFEDGQTVGSRLDDFAYDDFGNQTLHSTDWSDRRSQSVATTYVGPQTPGWTTFLAKWLVGLPETVVSAGIDDTAAQTPERKGTQSSRVYYESGRPKSVGTLSLFEGTSTPEDAREFSYDAHGNLGRVIISGREVVTPQEYTTTYDANGLFPVRHENVVHSGRGLPAMSLDFDPRTGALRWAELPDGSWATSSFDALARVHALADSAGERAEMRYAPGVDGPVRITRSGPGQPTTETELNAFALPVIERSTSFRGSDGTRTSQVEFGYSKRGEPLSVGVPHFVGTPSRGALLALHDELGRVILERRPYQDEAGVPQVATTTHRYGSRTTAGNTVPWAQLANGALFHESFDPTGARSVTISDLRQDQVGTIDALGTLATLQRGPLNELRRVTLPGQTTNVQSDALGRLTQKDDSNLGSSVYRYNGLGQLLTSSRNGKSSSYSYDGLGRMIAATTPDGSYAFTFDGDGSTRALVGHVVSDSLTSSTIGNVSTDYRYDNPGALLSRKTTTIEGEPFVFEVVTDSLGRPSTLRYPAFGAASVGATIGYDEFGLASSVRDQSGALMWRLDDVSAFGSPARVTLGNDSLLVNTYEQATGALQSITLSSLDGTTAYESERSTYDARGLLASRTRRARETETFVYDALARLTEHHIGERTDSFGYDAIGNLTAKPDVGQLFYETPKRHAVTRTNDGRNFEYDADGNQTVREGGPIRLGRQEVDYTQFGLPATVRSGPKGAASEVRSFSYDAAQSRVRERTQTGDETVTLGDAFRRAVGAAGTTQYAVRLPVLDGLVIELVEQGSGVQARFSTTDRLGSVIHVADQQRNELERREYEPYGKSSSSLTTRAGFTGHDGDVELGLINMKGRLFDPGVGRFLTPDPIVAAAGDTQAWNRYSYVGNSPLNAVDPSGFDGEPLFAKPADGIDRGGDGVRIGGTGGGGGPEIGGVYGAGSFAASGTNAKPGGKAGNAGTGTASSSDFSSFSTAVSNLTTAVFAALNLPLAPLPSGAAIHWTPSQGRPAVQVDGRPTPDSVFSNPELQDEGANAEFIREYTVQVISAFAPLPSFGKFFSAVASRIPEVKAGLGRVLARGLGWVGERVGIGSLGARGAAGVGRAFGGTLLGSATQPFKNTPFTQAGRALTKHPEVIGLTKETLNQTLRSPAAINAAAEGALGGIIRSGTAVARDTPRFGRVLDITAESGFGARFSEAGEFITFLNPSR
jgi:RHS repeat-associated protein